MKEEALYCTVWRTRFVRGCGPIVRQAVESINDIFTSASRDFNLRLIWIILRACQHVTRNINSWTNFEKITCGKPTLNFITEIYKLCTLFIDHIYVFRSPSAAIFRVYSIKEYNKSCACRDQFMI